MDDHLVECKGCGMAIEEGGPCGNPDCPTRPARPLGARRRAVYSPPAIEETRAVGRQAMISPFRCCASPDEQTIVLEGFSRRVSASWESNSNGVEPLRLVACRRCGVVSARPSVAELVPDPPRKCVECERIVVLPMDHGPSCSQNPESVCEICRLHIEVPEDHRPNCPQRARDVEKRAREMSNAHLGAVVDETLSQRPAEGVLGDIAQVAFTQAGDSKAALQAIRDLLRGRRLEKDPGTGALLLGPPDAAAREACPGCLEAQRLLRSWYDLYVYQGDRQIVVDTGVWLKEHAGLEVGRTSPRGEFAALASPEVREVIEEAEKPEPSALDALYAGVSVYDEKYRFHMRRDDYKIFCQRYGEDWMEFDRGSRAILAAVMELVEAREEVSSLRMQLTSSQGEVAKLRAEGVDWRHTEGRGGVED